MCFLAIIPDLLLTFQVFVVNPDKPRQILEILLRNKDNLVDFLSGKIYVTWNVTVTTLGICVTWKLQPRESALHGSCNPGNLRDMKCDSRNPGNLCDMECDSCNSGNLSTMEYDSCNPGKLCDMKCDSPNPGNMHDYRRYIGRNSASANLVWHQFCAICSNVNPEYFAAERSTRFLHLNYFAPI